MDSVEAKRVTRTAFGSNQVPDGFKGDVKADTEIPISNPEDISQDFPITSNVDTENVPSHLVSSLRPQTKRGYNRLHDYNSYNYLFTLASITPEQIKDDELPSKFDSLFKTGVEGAETSEFYIVLRSGGYKRSQGNSNAFNSAIKEAQEQGADTEEIEAITQEQLNKGGSGAFKIGGSAKSRDLFIDDVSFKGAVGLSSLGGGNITTGTFKVTEPYSVGGFYEELYNASRFAGYQDYLGAPFLLALDFVGHRFMPNEKTPTLQTESIPGTRRYFPIIINSSSMKVTEAGAVYDVKFTSLNSAAQTSVVSTLSSNVDSPKQNNPTVGSVVYHLFERFNKIEEQQMAEKKSKAGSEKQVNEIVAKNKSSKRFKSISKASELKVAPFLPHKYAVWFPANYSKPGGATTEFAPVDTGSVETAGAALNFKNFNADVWKNNAAVALSDGEQKDFEQVFSPGGPVAITNKFASSPMQKKEKTFSGFYAVKRLDEEVKQSNTQIDQKVKEISDKAADMRTAISEAESLRKDLIFEIQTYYKPSDAQLKQFFDDTDKGKEGLVFEKTEGQAKSTFDFDNWNRVEIDDADPEGDIATDEVELDGGAQKVGETLNELRAKYYKQLKIIENLKRELKNLNDQGKTLDDNKEGIFEKTFKAYGEDRENWQFKKGTTLEQNIHTLITDSSYAKVLDEETDVFVKTGFIKWYKIEKYAIPYGYDTYYNREVYEIHYCIQPYYVHYSQIPGPTEGMNYEQAKEFAVREYNYIFTGKNIDVMEFNLDFNNLFFAAGQYRPKNDPEASTSEVTEKKIYKSPSEIITEAFNNRVGNKKTQPVQEKDTTTANTSTPNNANQTARLLNEVLFNNPGEKALLKADIGIVGDPVFLVGSGIGNRPIIRADELETNNGEMNSFSREVDIIFNFSTAYDYPSADELRTGERFPSTMKLNQSVYSGLYKLLTIESNFSQGVFSQTLTAARRPNQTEDYTVPRPIVVSKTEDLEDKKQGPAPEDQTAKLDKAPQVKINSKEELEAFLKFNPNGVDGLSEVSAVEIAPSAIGFSPNAFGGALMTSFAEAKDIAGAVASGNSNALNNFVPSAVQSAIESGPGGIQTPVQTLTGSDIGVNLSSRVSVGSGGFQNPALTGDRLGVDLGQGLPTGSDIGVNFPGVPDIPDVSAPPFLKRNADGLFEDEDGNVVILDESGNIVDDD